MTLHIDALEASFDLITPMCDELVERFFARLVATDQRMKQMLDGLDMACQKQALLNTLVAVCDSLHDLTDLIPDLEAFGAHHVRWGVQATDYSIATECLLATLEEVGGPGWLPEYTDAWAEALELIQDVMLVGADRVSRA
jgi:hemoglobin-like flavoprotein